MIVNALKQVWHLMVLHKIDDIIKSNRFFSLIADETTDKSTKEQLSISHDWTCAMRSQESAVRQRVLMVSEINV